MLSRDAIDLNFEWISGAGAKTFLPHAASYRCRRKKRHDEDCQDVNDLKVFHFPNCLQMFKSLRWSQGKLVVLVFALKNQFKANESSSKISSCGCVSVCSCSSRRI